MTETNPRRRAAAAKARRATVRRKTAETNIELTLVLDGSGKLDAQTGIGFLDHMLAHLAKHSLCDIALASPGRSERG